MEKPAANESSRLLFIGLGAMGAPLAGLLAGAGYELIVNDVDKELCTETASRLGASACSEISAFDGDADFIVLVLPDSTVVESVLTSSGSDLLSRLAPNTVIIDMGSSEPARTISLSKNANARGIELVDAPVSGGVARAIKGDLSIMFGGS